MILFLTGKSERPRERLMVSAINENDDDILDRLLDDEYIYDVIVVTSTYVDSYGDRVAQSLKAYHIFSGAKIIYVTQNKDNDLFTRFLKDCRITVYKGEMKSIGRTTLDELMMEVTDFEDKGNNEDAVKRCQEVIAEYNQIQDPELKERFIREYSKDMMDLATSLMRTCIDYPDLKKDLKNLQRKVEALQTSYQMSLKENSKLACEMMKIEERAKSWEDKYLYNIDKINRFNLREESKDLKPVRVSGYGKPLVIYFKQIEDINFDLYFAHLQQFLSREPYFTKSVIYDYNPVRSYASLGYYTLGEMDTKADISKMDRMTRNSDIRNLVTMLADTTMRLQVLLILDKTPEIEIPLTGDNIITYYLGKRRCNYNNAEIEDDSFISPIEGEWSSIKPLLIDIEDDEYTNFGYGSIFRISPLYRAVKELIREHIEDDY